MPRRQVQLSAATVLVFGLLVAASLFVPRAVSSASPAQDEVVDLIYGESYEGTLVARDDAETMESYVYQVNVPPGAELNVWIGTDEQGGCWWYGELYEGGVELGYTYVGSEPSDWSEPIVEMIGSGQAEVEVGADTSCMDVEYPVYLYVYMEVTGTPVTTNTPAASEVSFWADEEIISQGECTTLHWRTEYVDAVYYQGAGVAGDGDARECPSQTTTYQLCVYTAGGEDCRTVTVYVQESVTVSPSPPPATATPWPTATPRPAATPRPTDTPPECPDFYEPNDFQRQAWLISEDVINIGSYICSADDVDYFTIPLEVGQSVELVLTDLPGNYDLEFYSPYEMDLLGGSYRWGTDDERIVWHDAAERGTYLIRVFSAADGDHSSEQPYTLSIRVSEPATPTRGPTHTPAAMPTPSTPWVLVVTDPPALDFELGRSGAWSTIEGWLQTRYGNIDLLDLDAEGVAINGMAIDRAIETRFATYTRPPSFILIVGGPAVVPFATVANPKGDGDTLFTDDVYGDMDHDAEQVPDVATARLPDGGDFELYNAQFTLGQGRTHSRWGSAMAIGQPFRPYASEIAAVIGAQVQWSPPVDVNTVRWGQANAYFIVHGADWDTSQWWGDDGDDSVPDPVAFNVSRATGTQGTVVSGACYGAYLGTSTAPVARGGSIALQFLRNGAEAFVGHTASTTSVRGRITVWNCIPFTDLCWVGAQVDEWPVSEGPAFIEWSVLNYVHSGQHPLLAYHQAKADLAASLGPEPSIRTIERKALHSFVFYGLPPAP